MTNSFPSYLKLHVGDEADSRRPAKSPQQAVSLPSLFQAFTLATGWRVCPAVAPPHNTVLSHLAAESPIPLQQRMRLVLDEPLDGALDVSEDFAVTSQQAAWELLERIDALVRSVELSEATIQRQEAQLASAVGVNIRADEADLLAAKLRESLQRAVQQTGSDAAAVYILDENTSLLKMRSCWGLSTSALSKPARPLRGALADLEALLGNAVLLENTDLAQSWNCPEDYKAALCLPIGCPSTPQGTLWLWSQHVRDFTSADIDTAKSAADKILVDIERSLLADEVLRTRAVSRGVEQAGLLQSTRLPDRQPLHADYEVAGWTFQGDSLGGNFHSWTLNRYGQIIAVLGDAELTGTGGALVATTLQTIVETCWNVQHEPKQVLRKANDLLWATEDGDWRGSLGYLQLDTESGQVRCGLSGTVQTFLVQSQGYRMLTGTPTLLGQQPDTTFISPTVRLQGGEMLVMASHDVLAGLLHGGFTQSSLLELIQRMYDESAEAIVDHLARQLPMHRGCQPSLADRSLVLLRRRF
ncbi:MAG: SpoIIE family protein phosphatase [Pirellulaceae bacterium]|nr:SpoIIE family protein phosphatase [Pirellulaceae bacterium]